MTLVSVWDVVVSKDEKNFAGLSRTPLAWLPTVGHIALEGRCFVLSACQFLGRSDLPPNYSIGKFLESDDILIRGGSCIIGRLGRILAGPKYDEECILTVDLDRNDLILAKFDFDVVGHYSRPDVFRLKANDQATKSVVFDGVDK